MESIWFAILAAMLVVIYVVVNLAKFSTS